MDPSLKEWDAFVEGFLADPSRPLAVDIETPWKRDQDEDDLTSDEDAEKAEDITFTIDRVSFAYAISLDPYQDIGASVLYSEPYLQGIRQLIEAAR